MRKPSNITIYTATDFPYGLAPENFVRLFALGAVTAGANINIIRVRGREYQYENDTIIKCTNLLFSKRLQKEYLKLIELFATFFAIPISLILNKKKEKTNYVILYGLDYFYYVVPFWIFSKILNYKLVRVITDFYKKENYVPVWWKTPKIFFYNLQFRYLDKLLNGLIVLSSFLKNLAIENKVKPHKILLIPNFINLTNPANVNNDDTVIKIGFFGTATIKRGFFDLIEAFIIVHKKYKNTILIISGSINETISSEIMVLDDEIKNNMHFTGFISKEELSLKQQSCNILVNPAKNTLESDAAFPTKLGEYFSTKRPVVSTSVGDLKQYFENGNQLILVEPDSPQSIAEGIIYLIENEKKAQQIGENGFLWAVNNLDYLKNSEKIISFLQEL